MRIADMMKRDPEYVLVYETCRGAARRMRDGNVGFLPVCDRDRRVIGTITDRDLAVRLVAEGLHFDLPVSDVMSHEVVAGYPDDDVARAAQVMDASHKGRLVIVDGDGRLVGIVSRSDVGHGDVARSDGTHAAEPVARSPERGSVPHRRV
ncbi:MAG: CBS domain-containing protein [Anaeromyxobacteraceae bacterium]